MASSGSSTRPRANPSLSVAATNPAVAAIALPAKHRALLRRHRRREPAVTGDATACKSLSRGTSTAVPHAGHVRRVPAWPGDTWRSAEQRQRRRYGLPDEFMEVPGRPAEILRPIPFTIRTGRDPEKPGFR